MGEKKSQPSKMGSLSGILFIIIIISAVIYIGFTIAGFHEAQPELKDIAEMDEANRIKIVVFNGCQDSKKTLQITDMIRKNPDIDVIDIIKSPGSVYPETMILDRRDDTEKMLKLASMLGLSNENIVKQRSDKFVDATLVIGIDHEVLWKKLKN